MDLYVWSPILAEICTLHELRTVYTLDDLVDMNTALQLKNKLAEHDRKQLNDH